MREERQPWRWWAPLSLYPLIASVFSCTSVAWPNNGASCNEIWIGPWRKYKNLGIPAASRRSLSARDFYSCSKHYGCWYMKVRLNLPDAAIAAQAGWSEKSVTEMVRTYAHAVDERCFDEIDAAFQTHSQTPAAEIPDGERM